MFEMLKRKIIYKNKWVSLFVDRVKFPNGRLVKEHHVVHFDNGAVGVIVENEKGQVLMIDSYRYVNNMIGPEIPAGGIDDGEEVTEAGVREVFEETGYKIKDVKLIYKYFPLNGICNQTFYVLKAKVDILDGEYDKNEVQRVFWVGKDKIKEMIKKNEIVDGMSLNALLHFFFE